MHLLIERKQSPLLGDKKRAEKIVTWSMSKPAGARLLVKRGNGITLEIIAQGTSPQVYLYFNPERLRSKLAELGPCKQFVYLADGLSIRSRKDSAEVSLICLPRNLARLWQGDLNKSAPYDNLLGMLEFAEDGTRFYGKGDCPVRSEISGALAVVGRDPRKRPAKQLTPGKRAYLYRDALLSFILEK